MLEADWPPVARGPHFHLGGDLSKEIDWVRATEMCQRAVWTPWDALPVGAVRALTGQRTHSVTRERERERQTGGRISDPLERRLVARAIVQQ